MFSTTPPASENSRGVPQDHSFMSSLATLCKYVPWHTEVALFIQKGYSDPACWLKRKMKT